MHRLSSRGSSTMRTSRALIGCLTNLPRAVRWCRSSGIWRHTTLYSRLNGVVDFHREVRERLDALKGLPIRTDEEPDLQSTFDLARAHGLSFYDALYLELAKRESADLATLDQALGRAAVAEGVPLTVI